tara:strand:- start:1617 stop:1976 length:360 start_codon:yes stop_codon:yes gene_type:complete
MINRSEIEERVVGAVKRMWKQIYEEKGPIPGITELNSQNFKGTKLKEFVDKLHSKEHIIVDNKSLSHVVEHELNTLEDLWNFIIKNGNLSNMPTLVEEVKEETKEDLLAIHNAALGNAK